MAQRRHTAKAFGDAIITNLRPVLRADTKLAALQSAHEEVSRCAARCLPEMQLFAFGSSTTFGLTERGSDVDFVLLSDDAVRDGKGLDSGSTMARQIQAHNLASLARTMREDHKAWKVQEIKRARVPLLKIQTPTATFDVSANRRNGVRNSWLLRYYYNQCPEARWLSLAIKSWSKRTGMNGGINGFLTSYAFNIMVVYYLLQRGKVQFVPLDASDVSALPLVPTGMPIARPDAAALGDAAMDFLAFYRTEFDFDANVVSLSRPGVTSRAQLEWTVEAEDRIRMQQGEEMAERVAYRLCIEDPYEVNLNVGRVATAFKMELFRRNLQLGEDNALGWILDEDEDDVY
jgi:DNA polymerase sigma